MALLVMMLMPCPARAEDFTQLLAAQELFRQAESYFEKEDYPRALALYQEAYLTRALPTFLFSIGKCQHRMGLCRRAAVSFVKYLEQQPEADNRVEIESMIATCNQGAAQAPAEPLRVDPVPKPSEPEVIAEPPEPADEQDTRSVLIWGGVGVSAALMLTGIVTGGMAQQKSNQYNDPDTAHAELADLRTSGLELRNAAMATLFLGAGTAIGTALFYFLNPAGKEVPTVSLAPTAKGGAVSLGGRF